MIKSVVVTTLLFFDDGIAKTRDSIKSDDDLADVYSKTVGRGLEPTLQVLAREGSELPPPLEAPPPRGRRRRGA